MVGALECMLVASMAELWVAPRAAESTESRDGELVGKWEFESAALLVDYLVGWKVDSMVAPLVEPMVDLLAV